MPRSPEAAAGSNGNNNRPARASEAGMGSLRARVSSAMPIALALVRITKVGV